MIGDPLTWAFSQMVRARNARYDRGRAAVRRLRLPVISVGNLSMGGSGKTPFVQTLGRWLQAQGIGFDVLSRGYGRSSRGVLRVDPAGPASRYGDEPLLLARSLGVEVFVGEDRYEAGVAAEEWDLNPKGEARRSGHRRVRVHILDDGFQHRRLHRDFDIVLLGYGDLRGRLLPFGRLREPLSALGRAQAVAAPEELAALLAEPNVWHLRRRLVLHEPPSTRPLAFCGLAQPRQFWESLANIGIYPAATYAFGDHHRYGKRDIALLNKLAKNHEANGFVTTEKDMVKLDALRLELGGPAMAPELTVEVENANARFTGMLEAAGVK